MNTRTDLLAPAFTEAEPIVRQDWQTPLPTVVFMGEFSSGKSSAITLLLRESLVGPDVSTRHVPMTRLRHGAAEGVVAVRGDGSEQHFTTFAEALRETGIAEIRIEGRFPELAGIEIVEIQVRDQRIDGRAAWDIVSDAAVLIWCTNATQAWKLSERTVVEALPRSLRERSILAVMRADLLRSDRDRAKVLDRLRRDASALFADIVFLKAHPDMLILAQDEEAWAETGGPDLAHAVNAHAARLEEERAGAAAEDDVQDLWPAIAKPALKGVEGTTRRARRRKILFGMPKPKDSAPAHHEDEHEEEFSLSADLEVRTAPEEAPEAAAGTEVPEMRATVDEPEVPFEPPTIEQVKYRVADGCLARFRDVAGFLGMCVVDSEAGQTLGIERADSIDCEAFARADVQVAAAYRRAQNAVGVEGAPDELLYTLGDQVHMISALPGMPSVIACVYLSRRDGNLAIARIMLRRIASHLMGR